MKKFFVYGLALFNIIFTLNVNAACGAINAISTDAGVLKKTSENIYTISVPKGLNSVNLSASASGDWKPGFGPRTIPTSNQAKLIVDGTSCGGSEVTYYINFVQTNEVLAANDTNTQNASTAQSNESESNNESGAISATTKNELFLKNIVIDGYDLKFEKDKDIYELEVPNDVTRIDISAEKEDPNDTVDISINAKSLEIGENKVVVSVTNASGKKGQYLINVTRKGELDNNANLSNLIIENYSLNFDPDKTEYNVTINKETTLDITATTASKKAKSKIKGNNNLKDGSKITIIVTAENGASKKYTINIKKNFDIMDYWMYLLIGGGIFLLLILLIVRSKKKKKQKKAAKAQDAPIQESNQQPKTQTQNANQTTLNISAAPTDANNKNDKPVPNIDASNAPAGAGMKEIKPTDVGNKEKSSSEEVFKL